MILWPILDEFSENFRKGGGGHFRSKKFRCGFFGNFGGVKTMNFRKKGGGHANPNEFRCKFSGLPKKAQHSFPKRGRRGGSEAVWKFSENSSKMENTVVPYPGNPIFSSMLHNCTIFSSMLKMPPIWAALLSRWEERRRGVKLWRWLADNGDTQLQRLLHNSW